MNLQLRFLFWTIIATLTHRKSQRTDSLKILLRSGWGETITNGVRCVPMVLKNAILQEMHRIGKKFQKWAETLEKAIGNPLFHWSHLELQRYFGYYGVLNSETAEEVWNLCNKKLQEPSMSARNLIKQSNVTLLCTTDDPVDDLKWHKIIKEDESFDVQVLPAWRPDKAMNLEKPDYVEYLAKLSQVSGVEIKTFADLKEAITKRMEYFDSMGCCISDHGLDYVMYAPASEEEVEAIFADRLSGKDVSKEAAAKFKTAFMLFVAGKYEEMNWVMQLHYGCKRDNNKDMYAKVGPDTGFDCMSNYTPGAELADFLNAVNEAKKSAENHSLQLKSGR